jgi:GNAT superfamily N-acetyltransferase
MNHAPVIRPLTLAETETLVDWARVEGWNPGLADAPAFHAADPLGFLGCFVGGRMASGIAAVRYGADFGFIGLYIAHPDFRGQGLGRRVWDAGLAHLAGRTIGLDGVPAQQANYRSAGFEAAYETVRWSGTLAGRSDASVTPLTPDLLPAIARYDRRHFPAERDAFLAAWIAAPRIAKVIVRDGAVRGYAVVRRCVDGCKIGPLFADTPADADALLAACALEAAGAVLHIDVPESQRAFADSLAARGFSRGFLTARMYRGPAPTIDLAGVYGVTSLELG